MNLIKRALSLPAFEDEQTRQQAYMLHIILWTLIVIPLPYLIYTLAWNAADWPRALAQVAFGEGVNIILLFVLKRGYVRTASIIQVSMFWLFFTITAATGSGIKGESYLLGYGLVIATAGILLGGKGAAIFTLLSLMSGAFMAQSELSGGFTIQGESSPMTTWVVSAILFPIGAVLQYLSTRQVDTLLQRVRASEERYRLISLVSSDYTFSTNVNEQGSLQLNWVAGAFKDITGYTFEEYKLAGGWIAHLHPDDIQKDAHDMEMVLNNQPVISEIRTFTKDRALRWVRVYAHPVWDEAQNKFKGIVGAVQDITQQKHAEIRDEYRRQLLEKVIIIGKQVTETQNLQLALQQIWHSIRFDLEFDRLGIYLYDQQNNTMNGTYGTDKQGKRVDERNEHIQLSEKTPGSKTFTDVLKNENGFYFTHEYTQDHDTSSNPGMQGVKDYAAVAAWAGNKPVAVLCVDNAVTLKPILSEQLEALRLFAGFAGLAIENSRLNDSLQQELEQQKSAEENEAARRVMLEKVILLGQTVTEVNNLKTTIERIWHGVHDDIGFDRLAIFLYDQETNTINGTIGTDNEGRPVDEWEYQQVLDRQKTTSFTRALETPSKLFFTNNFGVEFNIPEGHEMHHVEDFAAASAWAGDKPVAIITVDNLPSGRKFTQAQLESLRLFAGYAGLAIQNSKLNAALEAELEQRKTFINELENKNAELERFTYTVSHDLKSPLVTITGFLGYIEQDAIKGNVERVKASASRIAGAAKKMQRLLNDLLELSRIGRLMNPPEDIPFEEIVQDAIEHVRGGLDKVNASVEIQKGLPSVHGDRIRLVEVVQNLIDNAAKYSDPNRKAQIKIGMLEKMDAGNHIYYVQDNGIGIENQFHERIFGLFNKLDPDSEGTGIGLSLVKRIIEVHNGRIWVDSESGKGATFYFSLPASQTKE